MNGDWFLKVMGGVLVVLFLFCFFGMFMAIKTGIDCGNAGGQMTRDFGCVRIDNGTISQVHY